MKTCPKCRCSKPLSEFYARSAAKDKLQGYCKPCVSESQKASYLKNPGAHSESSRKYGANNRSKINQQRKRRRKSDPRHRLTLRLRSRINDALAGKTKSAKTVELLGAPWVWVEVHLESLFKPGMTWENCGPVWHIDHIRPCASFDLRDPEQQRMCFHWTNLQPLFAIDNLRKGDTYDPLQAV